MLLLQKQFPSVNAPIAPSVLAKDRSEVSKFQMNSTSPLSTDSSPSPPSANDDNGSDGHNLNSKRGSPTDEDHHKRKASADDFDDEINGQPSAKSQHTDAKSKKTTPTRRKSSSGEKGQDESRLLKRKEQNRAAQRAFRERKEKHVKDLEDKVAQLEAKTETQAAENDNLRDMLSRLQNENVVLKQATFTFSVPSSSNPAPAAHNRGPSNSPSDSINLFASNNSTAGSTHVPGSARSSVATASTHDSPSSLFEGFDGFTVPSSDAPIASSSGSTPSVNASTSSPDTDTLAFFGSPGPFTTISSNPMFTSYRDPIQSMNAFASFGGWDGDINMPGPSSSHDSSNVGLEDLFGDQFQGLIPIGGEFLTGTGDGKGSPLASTGNSTLSPIGHHKPGSSDGCPKTKQDIERLVASGPKGTFGESPVITEEHSSTAPSLQRHSSGSSHDPPFQHILDNSETPIPPPCDGFNIDELCLEMQRKAKCSYSVANGAPHCA